MRSIGLTLSSFCICVQWQDLVKTAGDTQDAVDDHQCSLCLTVLNSHSTIRCWEMPSCPFPSERLSVQSTIVQTSYAWIDKSEKTMIRNTSSRKIGAVCYVRDRTREEIAIRNSIVITSSKCSATEKRCTLRLSFDVICRNHPYTISRNLVTYLQSL